MTTALAVAAQFVLAVAFSTVVVVAHRLCSVGRAIAVIGVAFLVWGLVNRALISETRWYGLVAVVCGLLVVQVPAYRLAHAAQAEAAEHRYRDGLAADGTGFPTAEAAALAGWPAGAHARVVETTLLGPTTAEVVVDTVPSRPMTVRCERVDSGWVWTEDLDA